ncbi:cell surface protein [Methanosarcina sp. 1.H.A.2.2]|nr:cell surface protein [Methanosarcina sp. 1.H.A.2.2]
MDGGVRINRLIVLLAAFLLFASITGIGTAAETFVQSEDSIQEAVNSARPGDVIIVKPGTYAENIVVTKNNLVIRSESGNPEDTVIEPYDPDTDVLIIEADNITVNGFMITGAGDNCSGIYLNDSNNCLLENNKLFNNSEGIHLESSAKNRVFNNVILKVSRGIIIEQSEYNSVESNKASKCRYGIYLLNSKGNHISKNTILENREYGIVLSASNDNTLSGNTVSNNGRGVHIGTSDGNVLSDNSISSSEFYGLFVCPRSDKNLVFNNYFNNTLNAEANNGTANAYNKPKTAGTNIAGGPYIGGNFWAMPNGTGFSETASDLDGNGIADERYRLENSHYIDYLPLVAFKPPEPVFPVANLSTNISEGRAPLSVQFTDSSQNATSRSWDFDNDGIIDSSDETPIHTYSVPGTCTVNLTVSNENGKDSKLITITVKDENVKDIQPESETGTPGEDYVDTRGSQAEQSSGQEGISSIPGFEMIYGVFGLLVIFLYRGTGK